MLQGQIRKSHPQWAGKIPAGQLNLYARSDNSGLVYFDVFFRTRCKKGGEKMLGGFRLRKKVNPPALCVNGHRSEALYDPHA